MAMEDGNGDLGIIINTEMMILKGAIQAGAFLGSKFSNSKLNPVVLLQYMTKLKLDKRISESDFRSFKEFLKASEGDYTIASLPTQDADKIDSFCSQLQEGGVTYYVLPDLDMSDGMRQIAVLNRDIGKWQGIYEAFVSSELTQGGIMNFQELKAVTSGQYQIKGIAIGDYHSDPEKLQALLGILKERHVNFAVLPDLKYGDYNLQLAIANVDLDKFNQSIKVFLEEFANEKDTQPLLGEITNVSDQEYLQSGELTDQEYMDTASPDLKKEMESEKWQKNADLKTQGFENALAAEKTEREHLQPGQHEITINEKLVVSRQEDMIFTRVPETQEYIFLHHVKAADGGRTYVAQMDETTEYAIYRMNDRGLPERNGSLSGKELSQKYDPVHRDLSKAVRLGAAPKKPGLKL